MTHKNEGSKSVDVVVGEKQSLAQKPSFAFRLIKFLILVGFLGGVFMFVSKYYVQHTAQKMLVQELSGLRSDLLNLQQANLELQQKLKQASNPNLGLVKMVERNELELKALQEEVRFLRVSVKSAAVSSAKKEAAILADQRSKNLIDAIKRGESLPPLLKQMILPQDIKQTLAGVERIPTLSELLEVWADVKPVLVNAVDTYVDTPPEKSSWTGDFKRFLVRMFNVRELNSSNLTAGESLVIKIDELLAQKQIKPINELVLNSLKVKDSVALEKAISDWLAMLKLYLIGVETLERIKSQNV